MPRRGRSMWVGFFARLACLVVCIPAQQQTQSTGIPLATQDRLEAKGWWPTKGRPARGEYAGPNACTQCHSLKVAVQKTTPMAHASMAAADAEILRQYAPFTFVAGSYTFKIAKANDLIEYSVTQGADSLFQPLGWAFGTGEVAQTYVFIRNGTFYESRVSFYPKLQGLDLTLGHHTPVAGDLPGAPGRAMAGPEVRLCFGCHSTASTTAGRFDASTLIPGVTCEACHGPGAKHISAMQQKQIKLGLQTILNPARLNPVDAVDFCGACHRTAWDVALANTKGVANVRFQPYRLEKSRCWGKGDSRLTCMACHDPHQPLVHDAAAYDRQCLSCHVPANAGSIQTSHSVMDHSGKACPVSGNQCTRCHMAKYEVPGSHGQFTDHWIRVVRPGADYPD